MYDLKTSITLGLIAFVVLGYLCFLFYDLAKGDERGHGKITKLTKKTIDTTILAQALLF